MEMGPIIKIILNRLTSLSSLPPTPVLAKTLERGIIVWVLALRSSILQWTPHGIYWFWWRWPHCSMFSFILLNMSVDKADDCALRSDVIFYVHLRTLSTNEPHPKAPSSRISACSRSGPELDVLCNIVVSENMLALLCKDVNRTQTALEIWNWVKFPGNAVCSLFLRNFMQ